MGGGLWTVVMRWERQIEGVIGAAEFRLSPEEITEIEQFMNEHPV